MNLIHEQWIGAICQDGSRKKIAPWEISDPSLADLTAPRPDFKGALFQFLIGLLQTACAPESSGDWQEWWDSPPEPDTLKAHFAEVSQPFELDSTGPAFMQDYNLPEGELKAISGLLIEAPGGKTVKDNLDHFIKRGQADALCRSCAALALFTLQVNAPAGGVGHRVGLRGGGPVTTLVIPNENDSRVSLWHRLWLNILPTEDVQLTGAPEKDKPADIFPWLGPTRTSEKKTGFETYPHDVHPCQMYWGMPRRIRLDFADTGSGNCDLCGEFDETRIRAFRTKNYGVNYSGSWEHPLSPHTKDPKDEKPPIPFHGQKNGIAYHHWLGIVLGDKKDTYPALVTDHYLSDKLDVIEGAGFEARLWIFGYDMDNMKARCWYEATMPVYAFPPNQRESVQKSVTAFIEISNEFAYNVRSSVKKAWFERPADAKGDLSFIDTSFRQNTQVLFYECLGQIIRNLTSGEALPPISEKWVQGLRKSGLSLFDQWSLSGPLEDMDLKRVVGARQELRKRLYGSKKAKTLLNKV
jgi:CRISPR system Cascade subunit CasA